MSPRPAHPAMSEPVVVESEWLGPEDCDFDYKTWTPDGTYCRTCRRYHLGV